MGEDEDPFGNQFEGVLKKIEKLVNARLTNINEQIMALAGENDELKIRVKALETFGRVLLDTNNYMSREMNLLSKELMAFEDYVAKKDPKFQAILAHSDEVVKHELDLRKEEEEAIKKLLKTSFAQNKKEDTKNDNKRI